MDVKRPDRGSLSSSVRFERDACGKLEDKDQWASLSNGYVSRLLEVYQLQAGEAQGVWHPLEVPEAWNTWRFVPVVFAESSRSRRDPHTPCSVHLMACLPNASPQSSHDLPSVVLAALLPAG